MRLYIASWLAIAGLTAAQPVAAPGALAAAEEGWHNDKMKLTSAWAIEACDHILTTRLSDKPSDPCATFVSEHTQELVDARVAAIGSKNGARELCEEVAQILKVVSDDEAKHIMAEKMPLHKVYVTASAPAATRARERPADGSVAALRVFTPPRLHAYSHPRIAAPLALFAVLRHALLTRFVCQRLLREAQALFYPR